MGSLYGRLGNQGRAFAPNVTPYPPGKDADRHDLALHKIGFVVWLLPAVLFWNWQVLLLALVVRFALFDVFVNLAAKDKPFYVGRTAKTDKILQFIATKTGLPVTYLSALLKALAILFLVALIVQKYI